MLADLWAVDVQFVPQELNETERSKKKELMGAVWTQIEYKLRIQQSPRGSEGSITLEHPKAKNYFSKAKYHKLH